MNFLLERVVGSTAFGLATPDSDIDYAGSTSDPPRTCSACTRGRRSARHSKGGDSVDAAFRCATALPPGFCLPPYDVFPERVPQHEA